jgi:cysteine desulfurase
MPVYLDCASTTPLDPRVTALVVRCLETDYGNPASRTHRFGADAARLVERARDQVAAVAGCTRGEVVFTGGATESNNLAILGLADHGVVTDKRHIVSTAIEHNAVLEPLRELENRRGFEVTLVPPDAGGRVSAADVRRACRPDTLLVSVMQVNNETGVIQPIDEIAAALAGHDAYFHVDAAQGFGKVIAPLRSPRVDLISVSGHKLFAPKGVGALIARRRAGVRPPLSPLMFGGGQERGLRPGTAAVPLIAALGLAAELAEREAEARQAFNRDFRAAALRALAPMNPVLAGDQNHVVPHVLNLSIPGVDAELAMEALADVIAISNGSACTSGQQVCSHVLGAMGLAGPRAEGALRLSWCHLTPTPDWVAAVRILGDLRRTDPGRR